MKEINSSDGVLVHGYKSNNMYVVPKKSYNKMVDDSVTKTYRKAAANTKNEIDLEGSEIAEGWSSQIAWRYLQERNLLLL